MEEWRNGGVEEWKSGGMEEWRSGGMEEWRNGGEEEYRRGGEEEWRILVHITAGSVARGMRMKTLEKEIETVEKCS
jgi:hypothetical protein